MRPLPAKLSFEFKEHTKVLIIFIPIRYILHLYPHMPNRSTCSLRPEKHKRSYSEHHKYEFKPSDPNSKLSLLAIKWRNSATS